MFARACVRIRGEEKKGMSYNNQNLQSNGVVVELSKEHMRELIKNALCECQEKVSSKGRMILNESDFERLLAGILEEKLSESNWSVHTQLRGYYIDESGKKKYNIPDIVLLKDGFKYNKAEKTFENKESSVAFELKYVHKWGEPEETKIEGDFKKLEDMGKDLLYVVVLFDVYEPDDPIVVGRRTYVTSFEKVKSELNKLCNSSCIGRMNQSVFCKAIELKISPEESKERLEQIENK